MKNIFLSLGSNLGNREELIKKAIKKLEKEKNVSIKKIASFYETEPWGRKNQNWFLNTAIEIETSLEPRELLFVCNKIEKELGRIRTPDNLWGERFIDIDIIFYNDLIINEKDLIIPHKEMYKRKFVLEPLKEICPEFLHPIYKKSVIDLDKELKTNDRIYKLKKEINE